MSAKDILKGKTEGISKDESIELLKKLELDKIPLHDIGVQSTNVYEISHKAALDGWKDSDNILVGNHSYIESCLLFLCAQSILDGLASTVGGLSIRPILPDLDFYSRYNQRRGRKWEQRFMGNRFGVHEDIYTNFKRVWTETDNDRIVRTNDQTCMIIFGVQDLTPPELIAKGKPLFTNSIIFQRANVKIIEITDIQAIRTAPMNSLFFTTPILYKKRDSSKIMFQVTEDAEDNYDNIALLGFVAEPIGMEQCG